MLTFVALASLVLLGIVPEQSQAIAIYTGWERHALLGSDIRLSCSFFSWRWTSEEVTFSWTYRPDGSRDPISIFHFTGGVPYVDNKGPFRDRLEFVGNPGRRDGSILIKNLEFSDNGTFTCDAKNPPDIVGRPSSVRLLVFEKGWRDDRPVRHWRDDRPVRLEGRPSIRLGPVPPAEPSKVKAAASEKKKPESRKDKK
ncbi:LOW QUALITY PROTEIN: myelin protein P0 [Brachionichthys hirsutus]|uniref:LOW QUALITY PROTEIN: myelin protein P0 n=1 Tax=Brachionichthys hirsutus TaxID=412623 RepID=UPI003604CC0B